MDGQWAFEFIGFGTIDGQWAYLSLSLSDAIAQELARRQRHKWKLDKLGGCKGTKPIYWKTTFPSSWAETNMLKNIYIEFVP